MSSDGSVSSRISQFGLYRTIDARTEEFLKLSKKRQIKQGCVCAAISTALTVTIVVTVLLIYEYKVIAEAKRSSHKTSWLSLMNNSADDPNLLDILNKEKIDIDKTTLKLLPILLKAIHRNIYIEKIIEEPTSLYTPYEKDITTETAITKNIFADTRNWMKTPPSRLYTIEYKTSPIVYFKNPTRNVEYFTKIRKIRDYERMLNYVDKMISEKNFLGTTQPMKRDYGYTEKPYKMTTPIPKRKPTQKVVEKQKASLKPEIKEKNRNCKCSHKLNEIMNKLLNSVQQLLSYFSTSNYKETVRCNNNNPIQTNPTKNMNELPVINNVHKVITENYNVFGSEFTKAPPYKTFLNRHKYTIDTPTKSFDIRKDHTVNAIMNLIKPNFNKRNEIAINIESNEAFSTTNSYMKSDMYDVLRESSSNSHSNPLDNTKTKTSTDVISIAADYILQKGKYDISPHIKSTFSSFPESDFSEDEDYTETTERTITNNFKRLDTFNLELGTSNLVSSRKKSSNDNNLYPFKGARASKKFNNIRSMRKMGNLISKDKENFFFFPNQQRYVPILKKNSNLTTNRPKTISNYKKNITNTIKPTEKTSGIINVTKIKNADLIETKPKQYRTNDTFEEKTKKVWDENISKETTLKHIEEAIMILNNETATDKVHDYNNAGDTDQWEMIRLDENSTSTKSMIPLGRSTYLEMQRNDWKPDENHDFDNDLNYIFD